MSKEKKLSEVINQHRRIFIIIAICLFLIELEIFALAVMKSGKKSAMLIMDTSGNVIYEADGKNLTDFNRYYFEKNFGPLENYQAKLERKEVPFPFRAWFSAAIGVPIGAVLLIAFILKAYMAFFGEEKKDEAVSNAEKLKEPLQSSKLEGIIARFSNFNIFVIGAMVFLAILLYWVLPNTLEYLGNIGLETLLRFKWFFLGAAGVAVGVIIWVIYLRYLLAKKTLESKIEVEKHRLQLAYEFGDEARLQLEYNANEKSQKKDAPKNEGVAKKEDVIDGTIVE